MVSSQGSPSLMYEHGETFEGFSVVDMSLEEAYAAPDTSRDEEIARKMFGDLNCGLLRPPDDGNIIIISDSKEEEEVCEDDHVDACAAPFSPWNSSTPSASASACANDDAPDEV
jgi:hypothetical protein